MAGGRNLKSLFLGIVASLGYFAASFAMAANHTGHDWISEDFGQAYDNTASCFKSGEGCGPSITAYIDVLILGRDDSIEGAYLIDTVTLEPLLFLEDLIDTAEPGMRYGIIAHDGGTSYEFNAFGMDTFGGRQNRQSANPITFPFFAGFPASPRSEYDVNYRSLLQGAELNRRRAWSDRFTGLIGFRFIELREQFNIQSPAGNFSSSTDNDMYGLQIGGDIRLFDFRYTSIVATLKGGVFYDNADVYADALNPATNENMTFVDDEDEVSFVGEVMLGALVPMGPQAHLRVGYQMLHLNNVGLAPDQVFSYSIFDGQGTLDTSQVWYHGAYIGMELFW
jgi:hypothetical protein